MNPSTKAPSKRFPALTVTVVVFLACWGAFLISGGTHYSVGGVRWDFSKTAEFGESFGFFAAGMAGVAAIFAYRTYRETRDQNDALKLREETRDARDRRRENELTLFRLMELRTSILHDIVILPTGGPQRTGIEAIARMVENLRRRLRARTPMAVAYEHAYGKYRNRLGHYLRISYHVLRYIDERFTEYPDEAYEYARLFRAQLSNSEQILIALNCIYGEGAEKFKPLVEKYALLHTTYPVDQSTFELNKHFAFEAFNHEKEKGGPLSETAPLIALV